LEEGLRRERARSFHSVLYPKSTTVFGYRSEEDWQKSTSAMLVGDLGYCNPYIKAAVVLEV